MSKRDVSAYATDEYARLMDEGEVILTPSEHYSDLLRTRMPTPEEMHAEVRRVVEAAAPGAEFCGKADGRYLNLVESTGPWSETLHQFSRSKTYARANIDGESVHSDDVDGVRGPILHACRLLGKRIGQAAAELGRPAAIWWTGAGLANVNQFVGGERAPFALLDDMHDRVVLRIASYYVVTPQWPRATKESP